MDNDAQSKSRIRRFQSVLAAAVLLAGMGLAATASATPIFSASVGGAPSGADAYETFDGLATGSAGGMLASGIMVTFATDAQAVQGSVSGNHAAPYLSGGNGTNFGGQPDGPDASVYLTSGSSGTVPGAGVTLTFPEQEMYMGLLWGSVDTYNTLTFLNGTTEVGIFTGAMIAGAAGAGNCADGNQLAQGTCYVNINFSSPFTSVVATSSAYAFEFDNVAFSTKPIGVPEPGVASMFLLGLLLLGSGYWFKRREHRLG